MINIPNIDDNECFKLSLVRYLNPADHHPTRITNADNHFAKIFRTIHHIKTLYSSFDNFSCLILRHFVSNIYWKIFKTILHLKFSYSSKIFLNLNSKYANIPRTSDISGPKCSSSFCE